jgi:hypothetical protein
LFLFQIALELRIKLLVLTAKRDFHNQFAIETFYQLLRKERPSTVELFHSVIQTQDWLLIPNALDKVPLFLLFK